MTIEYQCCKCGLHTTNHEMSSMLCPCGGEFRPLGILFGQQATFEPYYDRVLRTVVTSYRQQEKLARNHRSNAHPEGLMIANDDKKFLNECKYAFKHKEEYREAHYEGYKAGDKIYRPGRTNSERRGRLVFAT